MMRCFRLSFALAMLLPLVFAACDQKPKRTFKPSGEKKKSGAAVDASYEAARQLLIDGKFHEAAEALHTVASEPDIRQPLWNWISMMEGMALLLDGREPEARKVYQEIAARGLFSETEPDVVMAKFFVDASQLLGGEAEIPPDAGRDLDRWSFEGIGFLLYGLKNWNLEKFDAAVSLLRQFATVSPEKMVEWADGPEDLKKLQEIALNCEKDYMEYRPAMEGLTAATSIEDQAVALEKAKEARGKMKLTTKLSKQLDAKIAELEPSVSKMMAEKSKMSAEDQAFDDQAFPAAKARRTELLAKYQFEAAKDAIADPNFKTDKAKEDQQLLSKKAAWLVNYKAQLIDDLNAKGYAKPMTAKNGAPLPGAIAKADVQQVYLNTPRGLVPLPWAELSADTMFTMGKSFIADDMPPAIMSFRKWHLGVFASYAGKTEESQALLKEAAEIRSIFAEELPVFAKPETPENW